MSSQLNGTPVSSRQGFVRGRKPIRSHPISELRKDTYVEMPSKDDEDVEQNDWMCLSESLIIPLNTSSMNDTNIRDPYTLRKKVIN